MKIEDNVFWLALWCAVLAAVTLTATLLHWIYAIHVEEMARLGYEETALPGTMMTVWQKAR